MMEHAFRNFIGTSFGWVQFPSFKTIVPEAEQAIYRAKEKNR